MIIEQTLLDKLHEFGLRIPPSKEITLLTEAEEFATKIGYPCVLKILPGIFRQKSKIEGVITDINNFNDLENAFMTLWKRFPKELAFVIQKQVAHGIELLIDLKYDPVFGYLIILSIGGMYTEIYNDAVVRVCPVSIRDADSMVSELRGNELFRCSRGLPRVRLDKIQQILSSFSKLPEVFPALNECELNPVICNQQGEFPVDVTFTERLSEIEIHEHKKYPLSVLFNPRTVALIGTSRDPHNAGNICIDNLIRLGFKGRIYPINADIKKIRGLKCYPSVSFLPEKIELAIIREPPDKVFDTVCECADFGIQHFILSSTTFSGNDNQGQHLEEELKDFALEKDLVILGPNSIGTINTSKKIYISGTKLEKLAQGHVSVVSESNVFISGFTRMFSDKARPRFAKIACLGKKLLIDETDFLDYFLNDDQTKVIGMYLENIKYGPTLIESMKRTTIHKPVVVVKSGVLHNRTRTAPTHSGIMTVPETVLRGIAHQTGFILTHSIEEMIDTIRLFELQPLPDGKKIAVISASGLGCDLSTDYCEQFGLRLAQMKQKTKHRINEILPDWPIKNNPVNVWSCTTKHGLHNVFPIVTEAIADDPDIDIILLIFVLYNEIWFKYDKAFRSVTQEHPEKMYLAVNLGGSVGETIDWENRLDRLSIPTYPDLFRAFKAINNVICYADQRMKNGTDQKNKKPNSEAHF